MVISDLYSNHYQYPDLKKKKITYFSGSLVQSGEKSPYPGPSLHMHLHIGAEV